MKKLQNCDTENCIPTPSSCVFWNGGDIEFLGICNGDQLNNLLLEIIAKLEELAGEDLSEFDIDSLLDICNQKAPTEITILSILNVLKANQICLKDFIDNLNDRLNELFSTGTVNVNLKCYADFDNQGNSLSITRDQLDQLVIDNLCAQKARIETLEGKVISLQSQIDNINASTTIDELNIGTCVDPVERPTSSQVVIVAQAFCDQQDATGDETDISTALGQTPDYATIAPNILSNGNYIVSPDNLAQNYQNALLALADALQRIKNIEDTCCAVSCDDVTIGFTVGYNEDGDGIILRFTSGAGTSIPSGFSDNGSTIKITDKNGDFETFITDTDIDTITLGGSVEIILSALDLSGDLIVSINTNFRNTDLGITCNSCISKTLKSNTRCDFCTITNIGTDGDIVIVYDDAFRLLVQTQQTTSTTTTTTVII
jgi:hypothetical protein